MACSSQSNNVNTLSLSAYYDRLRNGPPFRPGEEMQYEALRLSSFMNWPTTAPVMGTRLARAGFYYTGQRDRVFCFSCKSHLENWQPGDDPMVVHRRRFPSCDFIRGTDSNDVPISRPTTTGSQTADQKELGGAAGELLVTIQEGADSSSKSSNTPPTADSPDCARPSVCNNPENSQSDPYYRQSVSARLETFVNWPHTYHGGISPRSIAEAGFVFTGRNDTVRCVFCQGKLRNFEPGDDPLDEHRRHFPTCSFLVRPDLEEDGAIGSFNRSLFSADGPIVLDRPKNQYYAIEVNRLQTYANWPIYKTQTPTDLAHAGFYYAGFNDNVKCFFCDGGLRHWEDGDDPWVEHARWFPRCGFVKQCKGMDFIQSIARGQPAPDTGLTVKSAMTSPAVRSVIAMGFAEKLVRQILESWLRENGTSIPTAEYLIDELFAIEDRKSGSTINKTNQTSEAPSPGLVADCATDSGGYETDGDEDEISVMRRENRELKTRRKCVACLTAEATVLFLPCAHITCCENCAVAQVACQKCSKLIAATVKTYMV